ncbi:Hypothetical predicted protein [Cloeon dipterum]|uniref:Uncharacterized protein n=1 Tax=Cloeon dipterum TaxID=197152 RepID=A0A8S1D5H4_9INSE|nr:Hypothetical predicted protein [Cloeon dipterum]
MQQHSGGGGGRGGGGEDGGAAGGRAPLSEHHNIQSLTGIKRDQLLAQTGIYLSRCAKGTHAPVKGPP